MQSISFLKRLVIIIYDALLMIGVVISCHFILSLLIPDSIELATAGTVIKRLYLILMPLVFYGWFWTHGGQTLGMKVWNIYLIDNQGKFINWKTATIRYFAAILSWACIGFGFTWILLNKQNRAWHDILSSSHLVRHNHKKKS